MRLLAIDPGNERSSLVIYDPDEDRILGFDTQANEMIIERILHDDLRDCDLLAIEMIASYGMAVGRTVFETCVWIGRFIQACDKPYQLVYRLDVKMHLCHNARAKDANIRAALMDRFGWKGTKKNPGRLYGIGGGEWAALGVAVTCGDKWFSSLRGV